jgi:hypothetical protein
MLSSRILLSVSIIFWQNAALLRTGRQRLFLYLRSKSAKEFLVKKFSVFSAAPLARMLVLLLAFGLAFTACGGDDGGGGPVRTLNLSGPVTFENWNVSPEIVEPYKGPALPLSVAGGQGEISNGKFSFTIGTPDELYTLREGRTFINSRFKITQFNPPSQFRAIYFDDSASLTSLDYWFSKEYGYTNSQNLPVYEWEIYVYAETDVTVTGTGETGTSGQRPSTGTAFTISLKEGWNTVVRTRVAKDADRTAYVESIKIGNLPSGTWRMGPN